MNEYIFFVNNIDTFLKKKEAYKFDDRPHKDHLKCSCLLSFKKSKDDTHELKKKLS